MFKIGDKIDYIFYKDIEITKKGIFYYILKDKKGNIKIVDIKLVDKYGKLKEKKEND